MIDYKTSVFNKYYYSRNQQYSITGLTDSSGNVVERYVYDAYGNTIIYDAVGTTTRSYSNYGNPFAYTGRFYHSSLDLYYFRARIYDPDLGRFISRDQLGYVDGMSLYRGYFAINGMDPKGLKCTVCQWHLHESGDVAKADAEVKGAPYRLGAASWFKRIERAFPGVKLGRKLATMKWGPYGVWQDSKKGTFVGAALFAISADVHEDEPGDCKASMTETVFAAYVPFKWDDEGRTEDWAYMPDDRQPRKRTHILKPADTTSDGTQMTNVTKVPLVKKNGCCDKRIIVVDMPNRSGTLDSPSTWLNIDQHLKISDGYSYKHKVWLYRFRAKPKTIRFQIRDKSSNPKMK